MAHLEESSARHRAHVLRLEQTLRLLDNDALAPEDVDAVKDLVDDYLDRNQSDFDEFATPDDLGARFGRVWWLVWAVAGVCVCVQPVGGQPV